LKLKPPAKQEVKMVEESKKPKLEVVGDGEDISIPKPKKFSLDKFRSKQGPSIGGVETLQTALPHHSISQAKDFVRLHPNQETHWTPELCFVSVPIKGQKRDTLHMIDEEVALRRLDSATIQRFRLALASKPHDTFFFCHVPTQNLDNSWNHDNIMACETAMQSWIKVTSRRAENIDGYLIKHALNPKAFTEPKWPKQSLDDLLEVTFAGRMIESDDHPGLLRLLGDVQDLK
jgi:hypothetical protein